MAFRDSSLMLLLIICCGFVGIVSAKANVGNDFVLINQDHSEWQQRVLLEDDSVTYNRLWPSRYTEFDPTNASYWENLGLMGLIGVAFATISFFVGFGYCCCRWCCKCGLCIPKYEEKMVSMPTVKPQQKGAVTFIQISILFLCFLSIIAIIVGLYANIFFSAGLSYLVDTVSNTTDTVANEAQFILTGVSNLKSVNITIDEVQFSQYIDLVQEMTTTVKTYVYAFDAVRMGLVLFGFQFCLVTISLGFATGCLKTSLLAIGLLVMGFISMFFMWWAFAFNLPLSMLFDDVCYTASNVLNNNDDINNNNNQLPGIEILISCMENNTYSPIVNTIVGAVGELYVDLNQSIYTQTNFSLPALPNYSNEPAEMELRLLINATREIIQTNVINRNLTSPDITKYLLDTQTVLSIAESVISIISCDFVSNLIRDLMEGFCDVMSFSFNCINWSNMALCVALVFITGFAMVSSTTFARLPDEKYKYAARAMMIILLVTGCVGFSTLGGGVYVGVIIACIHMFVSILGLAILWKHPRFAVCLLALLQSIALIFYIVMMGLLISEIISCQQSLACDSAEYIGEIVGLIYIITCLIPDLAAAISLWYYFKELKSQPYNEYLLYRQVEREFEVDTNND